MFYLEFLELIRAKYKNIDTLKYKPLIENEKMILRKETDEKSLLLIWFCLSIIEAMEIYHRAFSLLKNRKYYSGWNELAQIEVIIQNIKYNIHDHSNYMALAFLDQYTKKFQKIFPYKAFTSVVFVNTNEECSICGKSMNPFSGCEHIRGKVYLGELCYSIVTDGDLIGIDFVEKPAMKCAVVFAGLDVPENYKLLEYVMPRLTNEYIIWDYKILTEYEPHSNSKITRNEKCPCQSGKKYKHCCMNNPKGIKHEHYRFILPDKLLDKKE
jgi:hypothetical protein